MAYARLLEAAEERAGGHAKPLKGFVAMASRIQVYTLNE